MTLIGWVDPEDELHAALIDELWPDSAGIAVEALEHYLEVSYITCSAFAPNRTIDAEHPAPATYVQAQIVQARDTRASGLVGGRDQVGPDGLAVTIYPMDRTVKALLRPRSGKPRPL